ncbi:MAG: sterol desaturase family protein, partial [Planctomycetes bacterium]|nr:sterol desaturase family protein [Planctomycetota bacterium]
RTTEAQMPRIEQFGNHVLTVLSYPLDPNQRIFHLYLVSSLLFAIGVYFFSPVYRKHREEGRSLFGGLLAFLFPAEVWKHPSAWVDVRFFIPHQLVRLWIYTDLLAIFSVTTHKTVYGALTALSGRESVTTVSADTTWLVVVYSMVLFLAMDFAGFLAHYVQHKIPLLWEFHKIHHSAEVLHPLTNYREHPADNVLYATVNGISVGICTSLFLFFFNVQPLLLIVPVLGIPISAFAFNFLGYNLRHSHIWIRWPGVFAYLFGCPAHHQIHHSCKRHHINKNFAFMFPIWDLMFGTYHLPKQEEEVEFGIGDGSEGDYRSFAAMYLVPFSNLIRKYLPEELQTNELLLEDADTKRPSEVTDLETSEG